MKQQWVGAIRRYLSFLSLFTGYSYINAFGVHDGDEQMYFTLKLATNAAICTNDAVNTTGSMQLEAQNGGWRGVVEMFL